VKEVPGQESHPYQISLQFRIPMLLRPQIARRARHFTHHRLSQAVLGEINGFEIRVAGVHDSATVPSLRGAE
jgi:hypothetical protein